MARRNDTSGRIILGTTKGAFFSLDRLAAFLRSVPLDLTLALNLDGGSVACQAVSVKILPGTSAVTARRNSSEGRFSC